MLITGQEYLRMCVVYSHVLVCALKKRCLHTQCTLASESTAACVCVWTNVFGSAESSPTIYGDAGEGTEVGGGDGHQRTRRASYVAFQS